MAKIKTAYFCQSCGTQSPKWLGKCPSCGEWNTFVEEVVTKDEGHKAKTDWKTPEKTNVRQVKPKKIQDIEYVKQSKFDSNDQELNRVLGGGIVPGALVLLGGEPGIGKSTLMLQIATKLKGVNVLYVSGEESESQIKMRAERIAESSKEAFILTEVNTQKIFKHIEELKPQILIIDSIQTLYSSHVESTPGSIGQVKQCTAELMKFAKESNTPTFLIGHINKDGAIAGPKVLEHMVDTVLQFEGDRHLTYRIIRTIKNRFGSTSELGIYEMRENGLREVSNPSEIFLSQSDYDLSGVAIGATIEGNRPLLIEVQSLVSPATYGTPQRSTTGLDYKRLNMLLAVLEKRGGFKLGAQDVFLNVAGGLRVDDPAIDLAVCVATISSMAEKVIPNKVCFAAEVGLSGEIRAVNQIESRIAEADRLGFEKIFISKFGIKGVDFKKYNIEVIPIGKLSEVFKKLFR